MSSYVPIRDPVSGQVRAVFEVYSDVTELVVSLARTQGLIAIGVVASLSALYLIVLLTARRADRVIAREDQARRAIEAHVQHQAFHDPLTGLPNRTSFSERLHECVKRARSDGFSVGLLTPDRFLASVEQSGLMDQVGEWVLHEACSQARQWCDDGGRTVRVSVNISGQQLRTGALVAVVREALERSGLEPSLLELELTESTLIEISESTKRTLQGLPLRACGAGGTLRFGAPSCSGGRAGRRALRRPVQAVGRSSTPSPRRAWIRA